MDVREVVPDLFAENNCLYLHCFDLRVEKVINPNTLPCVEIYTALGHVSFPATVCERRVVLLVHSEENVAKISGHKSPVVIKVTSSCIYKVRTVTFNTVLS